MKIQYEDRTEETQEQVLARRTEIASRLLIMTAIHVSDATPAVGLGGLSLALGQAAARSGADIDEVLVAVRTEYERVQAILAHQSEGTEN